MIRDVILDKDKSKFFKTFTLGFLIFAFKDIGEIIYSNTSALIALSGIIVILGSLIYYKVKFVYELNLTLKIIFSIYSFWIFMIIIRPLIIDGRLSDDSIYPQTIFGVTSYLLPFVVLFGKNKISFNIIFKIIYFSSIAGLCMFFLTFKTFISAPFAQSVTLGRLEMNISELANFYGLWLGLSSFSLLCFDFLPQKHRSVIVLSSILVLLIFLYLGRRSGSFLYSLYPLAMFYLFNYRLKRFERNARFILIILFIGIIYFFGKNFLDNPFTLLQDRIELDNRSGVDLDLINDLTLEEAWIIGKGADGTYRSSEFNDLRYVHETGYLYLILKGGIIYFILYVGLLVHASYVGFFKSKNSFIKGLSIYIFFHVIFLIPFGVPSFGIEYLLVWVSFLFCESKYWRCLNSDQIKLEITT
jgi:hypothetical protein